MENQFIREGISFLKSLSKEDLIRFYKKVNRDYYERGNPILTDSQYDILFEYIKKYYPNSIEVGSSVKSRKVSLPIYMGSMNKLKENNIENWKKKYSGPYLISTKVDGISGLYDSKNQKLYTRGNGKEGQDISTLIPYLNLPNIGDVIIRGEFIISKKYNLEKTRNIVAGIISSKNIPKDKIKMVDFLAYEVIEPNITPEKQFQYLTKHFPSVVQYKKVDTFSYESLSNLLHKWRNEYNYEIDGIIITDNKIYPRKEENPKHSFAFKNIITNEIVETTVLDVLWKISKDGYLKPRVQFEPISIGGTTIEFASGFNAKFIIENHIGLGTIIQVIRSGDVIPHILNVQPSSIPPKLPSIPYLWNETKTDFIVKERNGIQKEEILYFFNGLSVDSFGPKTVQKVYEKGYQSIPKILSIKEEDLLEVEGIQEKTAEKIIKGMKESMEKISLPKLLSLSNLLGRGFGEKKINLILSHFPNWDKVNPSISDISSIRGMTEKSTTLFIDKIPKIKKFLTDIDYKIKKVCIENNGKTILFSGFRDKEMEKQLKERGFKIESSFRKDLDYLIILSDKKETDKMKKAKEFGIKIIKKEDFKFLL